MDAKETHLKSHFGATFTCFMFLIFDKLNKHHTHHSCVLTAGRHCGSLGHRYRHTRRSDITYLVAARAMQLHLLHVGGSERHVVVDHLQQHRARPVVLWGRTDNIFMSTEKQHPLKHTQTKMAATSGHLLSYCYRLRRASWPP